MARNGRLPASALSPIPGGRLRHGAARAFNAMNEESQRRFDLTLRPAGPASSYRTLAQQWYFWRLWRSGRGNRAAYPGSSNHGWGLAVDLSTRRMRWVVDRIGADYGWAKRWSDAADEWWHLRYRPGVWRPPTYPGLRRGSGGEPVRRLQHLLRDHGYLVPITGSYDAATERTVAAFQEGYGLSGSGVVGPQTWRALRGRVRDRDPLTEEERRLVTELWRLRRAGWTPRRLARARIVKRWLSRRLAELSRLAREDGGWERRRRRARHRIIANAVRRREAVGALEERHAPSPLEARAGEGDLGPEDIPSEAELAELYGPGEPEDIAAAPAGAEAEAAGGT